MVTFYIVFALLFPPLGSLHMAAPLRLDITVGVMSHAEGSI
jgi:hypothetical protein